MISYSKWTQDEHDFLMRLVASGKRTKEIARILRRSCNAVTSRLTGARVHSVPSILPIAASQTAVSKEHVPEWYLRGWRFVGFSPDGLCNMERRP